MRTATALLCLLGSCEPDPRYRLAGIEDARDVRRFVRALQDAVEADDRPALAGMLRTPFTTHDRGREVRTYPDARAVLADLDALFTPRVRKAILAAKGDALFVRDQGVMIGDGEVWFDRLDGEPRILIKALNN